MGEAEEEFCKSMTDLISTVLTEGAKFPGGHRVALASNMLHLVPTLPLTLVLMPALTCCQKRNAGLSQEQHPDPFHQVTVL